LSVRVYKRIGGLVKTLVNEEQTGGHYTIKWDGTDTKGNEVPEGVYFVVLRAGTKIETRKVVLTR